MAETEVQEKEITATESFLRGSSLVVKASTDLGERDFHSQVLYMDLDSLWIAPPKADINLEGVGIRAQLHIVAEIALDRFESDVPLQEFTV